jgi:hypothetical protein
MTWFQDSNTETYYNSQQVSRAYVTGSGASWSIQFRESDGSVTTFGDTYVTEDLAEIALTALVATWDV